MDDLTRCCGTCMWFAPLTNNEYGTPHGNCIDAIKRCMPYASSSLMFVGTKVMDAEDGGNCPCYNRGRHE